MFDSCNARNLNLWPWFAPSCRSVTHVWTAEINFARLHNVCLPHSAGEKRQKKRPRAKDPTEANPRAKATNVTQGIEVPGELSASEMISRA